MVYFKDSSSADSATIINNYGLYFQNGSSAGSATITSNEYTEFFDTSTAGSAVITNNKGVAVLLRREHGQQRQNYQHGSRFISIKRRAAATRSSSITPPPRRSIFPAALA